MVMQKFVVTGSGKYPPKSRPKLRNGIRKDGGSHILNITVIPTDSRRATDSSTKSKLANTDDSTTQQPLSPIVELGNSNARNQDLPTDNNISGAQVINGRPDVNSEEKVVKAMFFDSDEYKAMKRALDYDENAVASEIRLSIKKPKEATTSCAAKFSEKGCQDPTGYTKQTLPLDCECGNQTDYYEAPETLANKYPGNNCDCKLVSKKARGENETLNGGRHKRKVKYGTAKKLSIDSIQQFCSIKTRPLESMKENRRRHSNLNTLDNRAIKGRTSQGRNTPAEIPNGFVDPFYEFFPKDKLLKNGKLPKMRYPVIQAEDHPAFQFQKRNDIKPPLPGQIIFDYNDHLSRDFIWHRYLCIGVFFAFIMWAAIFFPTIYILRQGPIEE